MTMHRLVLLGFILSQFAAAEAPLQAQAGKDASTIPLHPAANAREGKPVCAGDYTPEDSSWIGFIDFLPPLFRDRNALERYLRDPRFQALRRNCGDTLAVDMIFARAFEIADGSMGHALLIATLATFDHFRLGVIFPIIGVISFPLTLESHKEFSERYAHLPRRILPDSLGRYRRDRDKLQHFFGSAYLTYVFNSKSVANSFGDFVEWGEPRFIVGGDYDERDKYANRLGQEFGMRLLDGEEVLPSDILWRK